MKTLTLDSNLVLAKQIISLDFSADGKLLMVQCGEPDYILLIYRWFAGKVRGRGASGAAARVRGNRKRRDRRGERVARVRRQEEEEA